MSNRIPELFPSVKEIRDRLERHRMERRRREGTGDPPSGSYSSPAHRSADEKG